jgi:predicted ATPase/DNA-binding CsgD family transcriptional regulator
MIRNNLPPQPTPFLGRERELAELSALLLDPDSRLVTLLGPGGIGKTRLALEAAARESDKGDSPFGDGIFFVPLQSLNEEDYIVPAIADALKYSFSSREEPRDQLLNYLKDKRTFLVLDNFEHLLPGADLIAAILEGCPQVKILVTSREVLGLQEEWIRPVEGLDFPGQERPERLEDYSAVQLFAERARRVQPGFSLEREQACVLRICQLVQGMPLAIELAAAWLKSLPCAEVAAEIQHSLDFLATRLRNVPERHRSVRAVFDQSWKHLAEEEQAVFRRLAVFQGGFTRSAAEAVAQASPALLQALVDQSLLSLNPGGRYQLHELLRQFGAEQLDEKTEERQETQNLHARYFAGFLARLESRLKGPEQLDALAQMDQEIDNIRGAWRWMSEESDSAGLDLAMSSLTLYYQIRSRFQEGTEAFERAAAMASGSPVYGYLLQAATWFKASITGWGPQWPRYQEALSWMRDSNTSSRMAFPLMSLCFVELDPEEEEQVRQFFRDNLAHARENEDTWACAWFQYSLGVIGSRSELTPEAQLLLEESISAFEKCGDRWGSTAALHHLGSKIAEQGNYLEARAIFHKSLQICKEIGDQGGVEFSLHFLGEIARGMQEYEGSLNYLLDAIQIGKELNSFMYFWHLYELSSSLEAAGKLEWAVEIFAHFCEHYPDKSDWEEYSQFCNKGFDRLKASLPVEDFTIARLRGEREDLDSLLSRLVQEVSNQGSRSMAGETFTPPEKQALIEPLSPREQEVLALVEAGLSNREIAERLVITVGAVKKHLNNIFGKLQASSRTQAVARAREAGLLR